MPEIYDVAIFGCGAVGSAAAYYASKKNMRVLCIEQYDLFHSRGSSHSDTKHFVWPMLRASNLIPGCKEHILCGKS